jgi:hypothetical protein
MTRQDEGTVPEREEQKGALEMRMEGKERIDILNIHPDTFYTFYN